MEARDLSDEEIRAEYERRFGKIRRSGRARGSGQRYQCQYCQREFIASDWRKHSRLQCRRNRAKSVNS